MINIYLNIVSCLHSDVVGESYSETECQRDIVEIRRRTNAQGIAFLTKTLPRFGKAIDFALAKRVPLTVPGFKKKRGTQLPQFLWGLVSQVFDQNGCELPLGNSHALKSLRQICFIFYKLKLPYEAEDTKKVIDSFVEVDRNLNYRRENLSDIEKGIHWQATKIIRNVLCNLDPRSIRPKHGPGVVATGEKPWQKPHFEVYNTSIARVYPYEENFFYGLTHFTDRLDQFLRLDETSGRSARVVLVPKDSRGPRLISCEPVENQWIQQGQMKLLVKHLESHKLTKGHLNFTDQTFNRWYAWLGSQTGDLATLDMKEASDRVSLALVEELFPPLWVEALKASRSATTKLPDGQVVAMKKFAPMGSAVCFPVESLIFYALGIAAIMSKHKVEFLEAQRFTYVYGDDLIVSLEHHEAISQYFPKFGLMLNDDKCCTAGFFRESCGFDAYRGTDVTPTKIRSVWVMKASRLSPETLMSYVAYSNALYAKGYFITAKYIEDEVLKLHSRTPFFSKEGGCISFVRSDKCIRTLNKLRNVKTRWNANLHRHEVLGQYAAASKKRMRKTDWEELLRCESQKPDDQTGRLAQFELNHSNLGADWLAFGQSLDSLVHCNPDQDALVASPCNTVLAEPGLYPIPHRYRLQSRWTAIP